ncbi:major curlin subunit [Salmonella enterica subsp. enterica]|nr:major curlin subunit [Salmonella enterica subsp. enterica] [Salmonella enterica subsp. enterica serovar Menston]
MSIYQYGSLTLRLLCKAMPVNLNDYYPDGYGNGADVGQGADNSTIELTQNGFRNNATIDQWNAKNSDITVGQYGGNNAALVNQTASDPA